MADLKAIYAAVDEPTALDALDTFAERWDKKYPKISQSWRDNWPNLSTYFKYPQEVRRLIYTTNTIEGFNRQLRKVTKAKSVFPTDDSLLKMLYLAMIDITKKWTGRKQDWSMIQERRPVAVIISPGGMPMLSPQKVAAPLPGIFTALPVSLAQGAAPPRTDRLPVPRPALWHMSASGSAGKTGCARLR